jgi:hypothetical protein
MSVHLELILSFNQQSECGSIEQAKSFVELCVWSGA